MRNASPTSLKTERSTDGKNFSEIGQVKGNDSTSVKHDYSFMDAAPARGNNYYRLKQVDFDGTYTYSNIETVSIKGFDKMVVYPNPTKGDLTIETSSTEKNQVKIMDALGRVWLTKTYDSNSTQINIADLPKGVYFVECTIENQLVRRKIVKD